MKDESIIMRYASMRQLDISNGPGIGVALFVQGCHFHCKNCFNSCTWDFNGGEKWTVSTEDYFLSLVNKPHIERVSILGGEPLADENVADIYELIRKIRNICDKKIWIYTGYSFDRIVLDGVQCFSFNNEDNQISSIRCLTAFAADVVVDGLYIDDKRDYKLKWRGSSNQKVIDVKSTYEKYKKNIITTSQIKLGGVSDEMLNDIRDSIVLMCD